MKVSLRECGESWKVVVKEVVSVRLNVLKRIHCSYICGGWHSAASSNISCQPQSWCGAPEISWHVSTVEHTSSLQRYSSSHRIPINISYATYSSGTSELIDLLCRVPFFFLAHAFSPRSFFGFLGELLVWFAVIERYKLVTTWRRTLLPSRPIVAQILFYSLSRKGMSTYFPIRFLSAS